MDKLKISIICNGLDHIHRGSERFSNELYNLFKDDYDVKLIGVKDTHTKKRNEIKIPGRNQKAFIESYVFGREVYNNFTSLHSINGLNLILNNAGVPGSYWCNKIRKERGIPFCTFERGAGYGEIMNNWFKPDKIVYLTRYSYDQSRYKKKACLPIGINASDYQKKRVYYDFMKKLERPIFLSTSAIVKFKRIPLLIDAIASLERGTLLQTSDGAQKQEICEYGLKMLGNRFQYAGKVSRDVLLSLYQHSDCFVSASKHESFGIVYLEAMASGLPIITQADSRRREIVDGGGFLVDFTKELYRNSVFQDYDIDILNPLEQAKKFDWKVLKPRYVELIEEVAT